MAEQEYTQGRVRMSEETAAETKVALQTHVDYLLDVRDEVLPYKDARKRMNDRVRAARRGLEELDRVAAERGWSLDQDVELQRTQS